MNRDYFRNESERICALIECIEDLIARNDEIDGFMYARRYPEDVIAKMNSICEQLKVSMGHTVALATLSEKDGFKSFRENWMRMLPDIQK